MFRKFAVLVGLLLVLAVSQVRAQENAVLGQLYGTGVHAYYVGDYFNAHATLTSVIERGTRDPRPYYFRAMTLLKLGRPEDAAADMQLGSSLESEDIDGAYAVARSLERVQGAGRLTLERYRMNARLANLNRQKEIERLRFEKTKRDERESLRKQTEIPLEGDAPAPGAKSTPKAAPAKPDDAADDEAEDATEPAADAPAEEPAEMPEDGETDPFGEAPAEEAKPKAKPKAAVVTDDDPLAGDGDGAVADEVQKAKDEVEKAQKEAAADDGSDPFGDDAAEEEKPAPKAGPKAPADKKKDTANPFGDDAAAEEEKPEEEMPAEDDAAEDDAAEEKPAEGEEPAEDDAAEEEAPAAGEKQKEEAAEEDPFGES